MLDEQIVHIVDDDDAVRNALSLLMQSEDIPSSSYASAKEFLNGNISLKSGCLLLDVRMPAMNGLELLDLLKKENVTLPVVFITGHGDVNMAVQAMKAGATDFIEKPFDNDRLINVVKLCLDKSCQQDISQRQLQELDERIHSLTKREREVMQLLVSGMQNKMIARELNISPRTVELHRAKVMKKLNANSLSDLVKTALHIVS